MPRRKLALVLPFLLALIPLGAVLAATDPPWEFGGTPTNVSQSQAAGDSTLAVRPGESAAAWRDEDTGDLLVARNTGTGWSSQVVANTLDSWRPHLQYAGTDLYLVWFHGQEGAIAREGSIREVRVGQAGTRSVGGTFYGPVRPRLAVGSDGLHLVFAAAITDTDWSQGDLYYAYRAFVSSTWSIPTVVVTSGQVLGGTPGGVWYPDLVVRGSAVHVVWEQRVASAIDKTIWYVSGVRQAGGVNWGTPMQMSQGASAEERQPAVAVDASGRVHVVWTEWLSHQEEYIRYRRRQAGTWSTSVRLDPHLVQTNQLNPTKVWASIATAGDQVCVAWHGFRTGDTFEEILMRCSHNGGTTWGLTVNCSRSSTRLSLYPSLVLDGDGEVHLLWEEHQGGSDPKQGYDALYATGRGDTYVFLPLILRR